MATEAQTVANPTNASKPTGTKAPEAAERLRVNSIDHITTGDDMVLPIARVAEVGRTMLAFETELKPAGEVQRSLVRRLAICSVRMDRAVIQESATLSDRVRKIDEDFLPPDGADPARASLLREHASARALFDPSKEAAQARKYEAAAERGFFRALNELRQQQKQSKAPDPKVETEACRRELASILSASAREAAFSANYAHLTANDPSPADLMPRRGGLVTPPARFAPTGNAFEVPFSIGRPR